MNGGEVKATSKQSKRRRDHRLTKKRQSHLVNDTSGPLCLVATGIPAPSIRRPWADIPNPYPYACSAFCNHPRDPELRDILLRAKDTLGDDGRRRCEPRFLSRRFFSGSADTFLARYLRSDSRAVSPDLFPANQTQRSRIWASRRCITPDDELRRSRQTIVLALPRSKSFSSLPTPFRTFESSECETRKVAKKSPTRRTNSPKKPTSSKRSSASRVSSSLNRQSVTRSPKKTPKHEDPKAKHQIVVKGPQAYDQISCSDEGREDPNTEEKPDVTEEVEECGDPEEEDATVIQEETEDPFAEVVGEHEDSLTDSGSPTKDQQFVDNPISMKEIEQWFHLPRAVDTFRDRFELPIDITVLEGMEPLEYLRRFTVISRYRKKVFQSIYELHTNMEGLEQEV